MAKSSSANVFEIIDSDDEPDISHNVEPSTTTIGGKSSSVNVIDIIGSNDEPDISQNASLAMKGSENVSLATSFAEEKENNLDNNPNVSQDMQENRLVMSESESDHDDDNISNSLTTANLEADKVTDDIQMPRRRLKTLRKIESKSRDVKTYQQSISTNADDELEEDSSYSEEGNMSDFIVDDFDVSDCEDMSNELHDESNSDAESNSGSLQDLQDNNKDSYLQDVSDRKGIGNISLSTCSAAEKGKNFGLNYDQNNERNSDLGEDHLCVVTSKRKQNRNVVMSESENDDDDDLPISKLIRNHVKEISVDELANAVDDDAGGGDDDDNIPISQVIRMKKARRRRLKPLKKCVSKSGEDKTPSCIPTNDDAHDDDDESEEDLSESEDDFIVDDFDVSNCEVTSSKSEDGGCNGDVDSDDSNNSQDLQDRRSKDSFSQDVSDGEIDIELAIDPVLCMKAVCVINREQIAKEQMYKYTEPFSYSGRGFNTFDAGRGSTLAEFITDGDPQGDIKKTVEELKQFNYKGVKICKSFARRYSKQLYAIFKNNADPFFP
ncbi:hypothetical protein TSUD_14580 [Trifolium subterraneum]|uniref:Uncharacterized protein n=1 Tax=Trifolium subterraneum TaxID=3900 RepID=A0A2Z6M7M0_TRISU|nr:hypothetical protein TSUD_14580 [Trifolium subterraneum]